MPPRPAEPLQTAAGEWWRLGAIGFGGPPTHILLLRQLCAERRGWIPAEEFEDAIAAGRVIERQHERRRAARAAYPKAWRDLMRDADGVFL